MFKDHFHSVVASAKQPILWKEVYPFILAESTGGTPLGLIQGSHCRDWQQLCLQGCVPTEMPNQKSGMKTTDRQMLVTRLLHLAMGRTVGHLASMIRLHSSVVLPLEVLGE